MLSRFDMVAGKDNLQGGAGGSSWCGQSHSEVRPLWLCPSLNVCVLDWLQTTPTVGKLSVIMLRFMHNHDMTRSRR